MKLRTFVAAAAFAVAASSANATVVNFSGSSVNMGTVEIGQTGTITDLYQTLFTLPPNVVGGGNVFGFLPSNAKIVFSYTFTGLKDGVLLDYSSYNYNSGGDVYAGSATGHSQDGNAASGTINGIASAPLVFANANLTVVDPGTSTGTTTIINTSGAFAQFESLFFGLLSLSPLGVGSATYAVSAVPLPAALPMFAAALACLFGFSRARRKKALAA